MSWFPIPRNIPHAVVITKQTHDELYSRIKRLEEAIAQAVAEEREACAKVCEQGLPIASSLSALDDMEMWGEKFAVAIRARGANE